MALQKYDLTRLAKQSRKGARGRVILPPITERRSAEIAYLAALRRMLKAIGAEVSKEIVPGYRRIMRDATAGVGETGRRIMRDADAQSFDRLKRIAESLVRIATATVGRIMDLEAQKHTEQFLDVARSVLGIDIRAVVAQEDLGEYMQIAARRNAELIKSLSDDIVKRVELAVLRAQLDGQSVADLRKTFTEQFGIADRRAKIIARDQVAKLTSDLNRVRQEQAGIEKYKWSTSNDERVRPLHRRIDGNEYEWGKRTGAEEGLPPGQPIMCFAGSNRFFADHGVNRLFRYWHTGELTSVVTESGESFDATPNHPVLTNVGWKRVEHLQVGDYLVKAQTTGFFRRDLDVEQRYPTFADAFEFFRPVAHMSRNGMRGDLYGDPVVDKQIEIVETERLLRFDAETVAAEQIAQFILKEAFVRLIDFADPGAFEFTRQRMPSATNRVMRGLREIEAFLIAQACHAQPVGVAAVARLYAETLQMIRDGFPLTAEAISEGQHAFAQGEAQDQFAYVELARVVRWTINALQRVVPSKSQRLAQRATIATEFGGDVLEHLTGVEFQYRAIKQIVRKPFDHFVYTAETEKGWYATSSLVSGNCRCVARAIIDFGEDAIEADPQPAALPSPPIETPAARNARIDEEMRANVVNAGKRDNREHLTAYDAKTGQRLGEIQGEKNFVRLSDDLLTQIRNEQNEIIVHHNHPNQGASFSVQDLKMVADFGGLKGLWAHAHNGTSYYVERGKVQFKSYIHSGVEKDVTRVLQSEVNRLGSKKVNKDDIAALNRLYHHIIALVLDQKGYIRYTAKLTGEHQAAEERVRPFIDAVLKAFQK